MNKFLETAMSIAKPDWTVGQAKDLASMLERFYTMGVMDAAAKAEGFANECGGGEGKGLAADGYRNLADSIRRLVAPR